MPGWLDDKIATLQALANEGKSASQIALALGGGFTRNAVIGMARRKGVQLHGKKKSQRESGQILSRVRKAYARFGDDATLTRFVKIGTRRRAYQPLLIDSERAVSPRLARRRAASEGRSIFQRSRKKVGALKNLLVSGHSNVKIGRDVRIGPLKGYWIYTLSFEERATCPRSCHYWETCYGNNMPYAKRVDHTDLPALTARLEAEIRKLISQRGRVGILIRLHVLGDFFSVEYVRFWSHMLALHPRLAIYGYTARSPDEPIGREIERLKLIYGQRFAIRWSNGGRDRDCTVPIQPGAERPAGAFICPEQMDLADANGRAILCATCGLCWGTTKNVAFMEH